MQVAHVICVLIVIMCMGLFIWPILFWRFTVPELFIKIPELFIKFLSCLL